MKISKQGDVQIFSIDEIGGISNGVDVLCCEIIPLSPIGGTKLFLCGERDIFIKLWAEKENEGRPTLINTGLKWKTFDLSDNINILVKDLHHNGHRVLITKRYAKGNKNLYKTPLIKGKSDGLRSFS